LGVTISAQLAVAPFLVPMFGPMPVVAIPANVLAEPAAALVMMWGCSVGIVAGLVGPGLATLLHMPTSVGLWWVMGVARVAARTPLGSVGLPACAGLAAALVVVAVAPRISGRRWLSYAGSASIAAVLLISLPRQEPIAPGEHVMGGASLWRGSGSRPATVLVMSGSTQGSTLLAGLRSMGIDRIDLVIVRSTARAAEELAAEVRSRFDVVDLWAPSDSTLEARSEVPAVPVTGGSLHISVRRTASTLDPSIELQPTPDPAIRGR
jgi:competence protein ComEC